jgi:hypothetical protein
LQGWRAMSQAFYTASNRIALLRARHGAIHGTTLPSIL